ncbi:MAG: class I SAM-dependent methyltransferase [Fimbriimonas sp.]|nr:class I SAM-dependent methyltransferase [Fimbriimonas sp.]
MVLILYTTLYKLGGREMELAAIHMAKQKSGAKAVRIESKAEFIAAIQGVEEPIDELHFIGHSGLYGPMFGTTRRPDQMSRSDWNELNIRFAPGAQAFFHCCRGARWFAPYFAHRYGVPTYGHASYTTFSHSPDVYVKVQEGREDVYVVSVPGYKSRGLFGYARKRLGKAPTVPLTRFEQIPDEDGSYDGVAELYDQVFIDFRVRHDEWIWLSKHLQRDGAVVDIGCGNGALLLALATLIKRGLGIDVSKRMIQIASHRARGEENLSFSEYDGLQIPAETGSVDVVVSMLSWRYLDWDPIVAEIKRVLRPGGQLLIVDMVVAPFKPKLLPRMLLDKSRHFVGGLSAPAFRKALKRLVEDPAWATMLSHNPMRAEHEMRNYLPSRFPGIVVETLNRTPRTEMIAFRWTPGSTGDRTGG